MSILINMPMPKNCGECPFETEECGRKLCKLIYDTIDASIDDSIQKAHWCPLVEVPKHGDLIDRDKFIAFIKEQWNEYDQWFVGMLEARPVVVESEE